MYFDGIAQRDAQNVLVRTLRTEQSANWMLRGFIPSHFSPEATDEVLNTGSVPKVAFFAPRPMPWFDCLVSDIEMLKLWSWGTNAAECSKGWRERRNEKREGPPILSPGALSVDTAAALRVHST